MRLEGKSESLKSNPLLQDQWPLKLDQLLMSSWEYLQGWETPTSLRS